MSGSAGSQCKPMPHQGGKEWVLDHHNSFFSLFQSLFHTAIKDAKKRKAEKCKIFI